MEIHNWLVSLGIPESFDQSAYKRAAGTSFKAGNVYSDGSLMILTSNQNPNLQVNFSDMFPISLSELNFDATDTNVTYLEASVTFRYRIYNIVEL
jgi:hypothetical protein